MSDELIELPAAGGWQELLEPAGWPALEQALPGYMRPRRWFSGKARQLAEARVQAALPLPYAGRQAALVIVRADYADGGGETYLLPLAWAAEPAVPAHALLARAAGGLLYDPIYDAEFCAALLDLIAREGRIATPGGELVASAAPGFAQLRGPADQPLAPLVSTAEQSNSSIIFGGRLIMKLFRRIEPGLNPDLEIGRFLAARGGFAGTPPLAGAIEYAGAGEPASVALLQGFVPNQGDAWYFTLRQIAASFRQVLADPGAFAMDDAPGGPLELARQSPPVGAQALLGGYAAAAALLGRRTGELHLALVGPADSPEFAPEPIDAAYLDSLYRTMEQRARLALDLLRASVARLPDAPRAQAERVLASEARIFELLGQVRGRPIAAQRTRIHGDYHLGQVLATGDDFLIIDFEGEPARPLSERRQKNSVLQDVAGMLRSLHYAPYAVVLGQAPGVRFDPAEAAALEPWARRWYRWAGATFLRAYLEAVGAAPLLPAENGLRTLLDALVLDKAVYELRYELNNRPAWSGIPLEGVLQLV